MVPSRMVCDAGVSNPVLVAALEQSTPVLKDVMASLRRMLPLMPDARVANRGGFFRLPQHYRSVCLSLAGDREEVGSARVVVFKGTEPLLPDLHPYLTWMQTARFRDRELPIGEHLPLVLGKAPAALSLSDARRDQAVTMTVHARHFEYYGEVAQFPVPLFVHQCSEEAVDRYLGELQAVLLPQSLHKVEASVRGGLGVGVYFYFGVPIRVSDLPNIDKGVLISTTKHLEEIIERWCRWFVRLLYLGFLPAVPWNRGRGLCLDPGNACVDGGLCDLDTVTPLQAIRDDRAVHVGVAVSLEMLKNTIVIFLRAHGRADSSASFSILTAALVRSKVVRLIDEERRSGLELDRRVMEVFNLTTLSELVETVGKSIVTTDPYRPAGEIQTATESMTSEASPQTNEHVGLGIR